MELPPGECERGYTLRQVEELVSGERGGMERFTQWFAGQTSAICEGRTYNHDTKEHEVSCGGVAHGLVIYRHDVARYLRFRAGKAVLWD